MTPFFAIKILRIGNFAVAKNDVTSCAGLIQTMFQR